MPYIKTYRLSQLLKQKLKNKKQRNYLWEFKGVKSIQV